MRNWISLMLSEAPGEPSVRRVVFFIAFWITAAIELLGIWFPPSDALANLVITVFITCAGTVGIGRVGEALERRSE